MKKNPVFILSVLAVLLTLVCGGCKAEKAPAYYDTRTGLTLTMEEGMSPFESDGITAALSGESSMMTAVRHEYELYAELGFDIAPMTVEEYAEFLTQISGSEQEFSYDAAGNYHVTYTARVDGRNYYYYGIMAKGTDAFWMVTFSCLEDDIDRYSVLFPEWGSSIEVN